MLNLSVTQYQMLFISLPLNRFLATEAPC